MINRIKNILNIIISYGSKRTTDTGVGLTGYYYKNCRGCKSYER